MYPGTITPEGWLACNGQRISRQLYPELYRIVGPWYTPANQYTTFSASSLDSADVLGAWEAAAEEFFKLPNLDYVPLPQGEDGTDPVVTETVVTNYTGGTTVAGNIGTDGLAHFLGDQTGVQFNLGRSIHFGFCNLYLMFNAETTVRFYATNDEGLPYVPPHRS